MFIRLAAFAALALGSLTACAQVTPEKLPKVQLV